MNPKASYSTHMIQDFIAHRRQHPTHHNYASDPNIVGIVLVFLVRNFIYAPVSRKVRMTHGECTIIDIMTRLWYSTILTTFLWMYTLTIH